MNVGVDQTLAVGQTLDLQAAVVDDGWPNPPGAVTLQWTSQSGPATPTWPLNDANQAHTHVVFPTAGTYVLRLTANDGQYTSFGELTVTVFTPNARPTVSLGAPVDGAVFAYNVTSIALTANAADSDGNVVRVDFYADGGLIGSVASAPYAMTWVGASVGVHTLTAVAVDDGNASTVSTPVNVAINAAPTVTLTTPAQDGSVFGPSISVNFAIANGAVATEAPWTMLPANDANALRQQGRWFAYNGVARYLVGGDTQEIHADSTWFDYTALLDKFQVYRINKVRIFIDPLDLRSVRRPYAYNSGTQQYDLDTWDSTYWSTTRDFLDKALARNVIVEINMSSLYPGCTSVWNNAGPSGIDRPIQYNKANNSNNAFTSNTNSNFSPQWFDPTYAETSSSGRTVFDYQRRLYDKVLAELGTYPNVYFEVHNEAYSSCAQPAASTVTAYLRYWAAYLRANTARPVSVEVDTDGISDHYSDLWNDASANVLNSHFPSVDPGAISADMHAAQLKGKLFETNESGLYDFYVRPSNWWLTPSAQWALDSVGLDETTKEMWGLFLSGSTLGWYNLHQSIANWDQVGTRIKVLRDVVDTLANLGAIVAGRYEWYRIRLARQRWPERRESSSARQPGERICRLLLGYARCDRREPRAIACGDLQLQVLRSAEWCAHFDRKRDLEWRGHGDPVAFHR